MRRSFRTLCLLIISGTGTLHAGDGWRVAEPGWRYEFPGDHGPHREFKTEWWYATGTLVDGGGHDYGFQLTFFRQGLKPGSKPPGSSRFRVSELPFAHFAVTDVTGGTFRHFQKSSRGAFGEAGFSIPTAQDPRMAWIEGWELRQESPGHFRLKASDEGRAIDLTLVQERDPLVHGKDGISPKSAKPGHASHYYSLTRMRASGNVTIEGITHAVSGLVWFDHEWATNSLDADEAGWDWSGLHLSNGEDLMLFRIRDKTGATVFTAGTLRDANGAVTDLKDLSIEPQGRWKSPHTAGIYPGTLSVGIPSRDLHLNLMPRLRDQELLLTPFAYWEGAVKGEGNEGPNNISAEGYLELTGYGGRVVGVNGK
jgi:predicted secreted hydrolase